MRRLLLPLLLCVFLLPALVGCGERVPDGVDPEAQAAWTAWQAEPGPPTLTRLIIANRKAAARHAVTDDALGVLYQVRGTEALAARSEAGSDLEAGQSIDESVTDLEEGGILDVYEEVVPGSRARLLACRDRMRLLLGRD